MRCALLTTDTTHHRFCANRLARKLDLTVVLETSAHRLWRSYWKHVRRKRSLQAMVDNPYLQSRRRRFNDRQVAFESRFFQDGVPPEFTGHTAMHSFPTVNDPECVSLLRDLRPDLMISFGTGLIRPQVLELDGLKVNVHRGILPRYRGLDSDLWACWFRDFDNIGTTIHVLEPRHDVGAIVEQRRFPLKDGVEAHHLRYYTTILAVEMLEALADTMLAGGAPALQPQDLSKGAYYSYIPPLRRLAAIHRLNAHVAAL